MTYQQVIAYLVPNTIAMPAMDHVTLISTEHSPSNYLNWTIYDKDDPEALMGAFKRAIK